jgi:predicted transcriptional regulator of viral defense system
MGLPKLHTLFYRQQVFTFDEARQKLKINAIALNKMLHELQRNGYVVRIKKGLYAVVPVETVGKSFAPNKYLVAAKLQKKACLSYHTALELHGAAESVFNTLYISVPRQARPFHFQETTYSFVTNEYLFGLTKVKVDGISLSITDREKTILDGIDRLKYAGGVEEYLKSVSSFPSIHTSRLLQYLQHLDKKVLYAKAGWLLSRMAKQWSIEEQHLKKLRGKLSSRTFYLQEGNGNTEYRFNDEWNLMIPANLESKLEETA